MGNTGFWIDKIILRKDIMPTNDEFFKNPNLRQELCPLIWNDEESKFIDGSRAASFIQVLIDQNHPEGPSINLERFIVGLTNNEEKKLKALFNNSKLICELQHRKLAFKKNFSRDVVLKLSDLGKGLGVKKNSDDLIQTIVEEKLGIHTSSACPEAKFRHWIVFNAREQYFEVVYGITIAELRELIRVDNNMPNKAKELARGHINNAFSMCDAQGTTARQVDLQGFQGAFTPEFYPRRFALKDSIYAQRLDVLAALLDNILNRYRTCDPPVTYCELSVGLGDLTRAWVFDVLRSFPDPQLIQADDFIESSFRKLVRGGHFPELAYACGKAVNNKRPLNTVTYKFLAGFKRQSVQKPLHQNQKKALDLLNEAPQLAIHLMVDEIFRSNRKEEPSKNNIFYLHKKDLEKLEKFANKASWLYDWVVGLDLFGDEMGFPYCPFVMWPFIDYVKKRREYNPCFGLRIHCGENVPFADADAPAYRLFAAHMYIVFCCLRYLQSKLEYGIRVGHGIAFQRILDHTMRPSKHRKSSVLLAEIQYHAQHVFKTIAFEVNITSNEYLLGHALRQGNFHQPLKLNALLELEAPVFLATDDDGVWPIVCCPTETTHHSLVAEYCRAISSSTIKSKEVLEKMFADTKKFWFYSDKSKCQVSEVSVENKYQTPEASVESKCQMPEPSIESKCPMPKATLVLSDDICAPTVVLHPDVIKLILRRCQVLPNTDYKCWKFYKDFFPIYKEELEKEKKKNKTGATQKSEDESWKETCTHMAPIAYIAYCTDGSRDGQERIRDEYKAIFENIPDLGKTYEEWKNVYQQLIKPNIANRSQFVTTSVSSSEHIFFSEGSHTKYPDQSQSMKDLIDYLQNNYHRGINIHVFTRYINIATTIKGIRKELARQCNSLLSVIIYSNKDKDKYKAFDKTNIMQLQINPTPSQRTHLRYRPDGNSEVENQNALYIVCPHASAATAFLHFIGEHLSTDDDAHRQHSTMDTGTSVVDNVITTPSSCSSNKRRFSSDDDEND